MPSTRALESQSFSPTFTLSILTNYFLSNALKLQTSRAQVAHTPPAKTPEAIMQLSAEHLQNFSQRVFFIEAFYPEQKKPPAPPRSAAPFLLGKESKTSRPPKPLLANDFPYADSFFNALIVDGNLIRCPRKMCGYCGIAHARISVHAHILLLGLDRVLVTPIRRLVALGTFAVVDHR